MLNTLYNIFRNHINKYVFRIEKAHMIPYELNAVLNYELFFDLKALFNKNIKPKP